MLKIYGLEKSDSFTAFCYDHIKEKEDGSVTKKTT